MTHEETANVALERCALLRWKGMFVAAQWDETVPHGGDGLFWCQTTQNCLGPDGTLVDRDECHPGRPCFRAL
jgi:hypothetical protein